MNQKWKVRGVYVVKFILQIGTTEELIHHMPVSLRTGRHCCLRTFSYTKSVLLTLVGYRCDVATTRHGICVRLLYVINWM